MFSSSKTLTVLGLLVPFTLAQYGGGPAPPLATPTPAAAAAPAASSGTATSSAASNTQTVVAGLGGESILTFSPSTIMAAPGTFVEFQFMPLNHSVAQSTFETPCSPANSSTFFAGFQFFTSTSAATNVFTVAINNTDPIWFFCPQTTDGIHHCTSGMVGVINPPAGKDQTMFAAIAANATSVVVPAQIQGGIIAAASAASSATSSASTSAASAASSGSASQFTAGMGFMGLVGIGFSALLSF